MMRVLLLVILLSGCGDPPDHKKIVHKNEITQKIFIHKGKPITCIGRLSCDWISYHDLPKR